MFKGTFNAPQPAPGSSRDPGMGPCCAKCKTPFGHSAVAGTCCHNTKETK